MLIKIVLGSDRLTDLTESYLSFHLKHNFKENLVVLYHFGSFKHLFSIIVIRTFHPFIKKSAICKDFICISLKNNDEFQNLFQN